MVIFYKKWKKYNELQLTKNKMDLNIRKMTNHPPSPAKSNPMHPLSGALPLPSVLWLLKSTRSRLLVVGLLSIAEALCPSLSLWNDLSDPVFDGMGLAGFRAEPMLSCWHDLLFFFISYCFIVFFLPWVGCVGLGSLD